MNAVYVWDKDFSEGWDWAMRCDSVDTANELIKRIQDGMENSRYAGMKINAKIVDVGYFPGNVVPDIDALPLITLEMMNNVDDIENMLANASLCYSNDDVNDKDKDEEDF